MSGRLERALADLVGGYDGGWTLWTVALGNLERAVADSREAGEPRFRSYPGGELNRLLVRVEDALRVATLAVELQSTLQDEADPRSGRRADDVAALLLERAHAIVDERLR